MLTDVISAVSNLFSFRDIFSIYIMNKQHFDEASVSNVTTIFNSFTPRSNQVMLASISAVGRLAKQQWSLAVNCNLEQLTSLLDLVCVVSTFDLYVIDQFL